MSVAADPATKPAGSAARRLIADLHARDVLVPGDRPVRPSVVTGIDVDGLFFAPAELMGLLDRSLLRWPYVTVVHHGATSSIGEFTRTRNVIGHRRDGFVDRAKIRALMNKGVSVKFNSISHWHRPVRELVTALEAQHPWAVSSYAFWTPPAESGMLPHRDPGHVVAIQLAGRKRWQLFDAVDDERGTPGIDVDLSRVTDDFVVSAGDVVVLPHGTPHAAHALDEESLHLTLTLTEPSAIDLLEGFRQVTVESDRPTFVEFDKLSLDERPSAVIAAMRARVHDLDTTAWLDATLALMREKTG
ncbi:hypothetical protein MARA_00660 (plasmid) [Mycolicibacterium arabiense]|uniref:JmjC domain-containing protein n=1 Tax=Mycolicibacterium arabiense TaxID=1286181 RepID=A0A7I7RRF6_9MYCO|nr:cupin domain-containing protein [Mycolicibacterium arabiense]MCV7372034.1 hypothetical protein [Mycolicibacterium arabiense]BBY46636.1 hypothetical protein MARA_00660 [Mycolicibacterium arabiense]